MDGRIKDPVQMWFKIRKGYDFVDVITEAGPLKYLFSEDQMVTENLKNNAQISVEAHGSDYIVVSGHHDCAGNPFPREDQIVQIHKSVEIIRGWGFPVKVGGIYVNDMWAVEEII
jgi:hypothetical protein